MNKINQEDYQSLFMRRKELLDATYAGHKPPKEEWEKLAADFRAADMPTNADCLMDRWERM